MVFDVSNVAGEIKVAIDNTIVNPIYDSNVLPFRIDYINTIMEKKEVRDKEVLAIDGESTLADLTRIKEIVKCILEHFDQKTKRNSFYSLQGQRLWI